jgi:hypothetical protein
MPYLDGGWVREAKHILVANLRNNTGTSELTTRMVGNHLMEKSDEEPQTRRGINNTVDSETMRKKKTRAQGQLYTVHSAWRQRCPTHPPLPHTSSTYCVIKSYQASRERSACRNDILLRLVALLLPYYLVR